MLHEIFQLFREQEPLPFIILAFLSVGWVIIVERFIVLRFIYHINFTKFNKNIRKMLAAGDMERARNLCTATAKVGVPLIAAKAIDAYESDPFRVRMTVSEEMLSFVPRIRRRISQLPSLATATLFVGAIAALYGVWDSFNTSEVLELGIKSFAFTQGLGKALIPLTVSLFVAMALIIPYGFLDAIAARLEGEIELTMTIILNIIAPETQTFATAATIVENPNANMGAKNTEIEQQTQEVQKGNDNDVATESFDEVPDEEEII